MALRGYLIDTQTVSYWFDQKLPQHANVVDHVNSLPDEAPLMVSAVTIGEIAFGHATTTNPDAIKQAAFNKFVQDKFKKAPLEITKFTAIYYGEVRNLLFKKYPPPGKRQRRPEQCFDPITSLELGIDENDLWIASQAYEHNLVLVTNDGMCRIRDVAGHLLIVENWTDPI
jgi:tRNA(fMet)-specific endonuclease VapC